MELSAEIIKEMGNLKNNPIALTKLLNYVRKLVRDSEAISKEKVIDNLTLSLQEVRQYKEGKIQLKSWDDIKDEL